jgi:hypothetical protein
MLKKWIGMGLIAMTLCIVIHAQTEVQKVTVIGKLTRVMAVGGESTGWAIQTDSAVSIDGKSLDSVEIEFGDKAKLQTLENERVRANGKITHRHGVESGDRLVLEVSSIKKAKPRS